MDFSRVIEENRRLLVEDFLRSLEDALRPFQHALDAFLGELFRTTLPSDWRQQWHDFVAQQAGEGFEVAPQSVHELEEWIEAWAKFWGLLPDNQVALQKSSVTHESQRITARVQASESVAPRSRPDAGQQPAETLRPKAQPSNKNAPPARPSMPRPANAADLNPDDYTSDVQNTLGILGGDWKNVSLDAMRRLRASGQVIDQTTGAVLGHGANALGVEAFVRLKRKDGGVDTARFRFVSPWLSAAHWEFVDLKRGTTPQQEAAKVETQQRIRHADVMRVRGAINRIQGGMFAIVGGVHGIAEGAPLLGTLEAARGAEDVGLAGTDLATGKEHRAFSAIAIQAILESAGVDEQTARFLADSGGLLVALGRATVDAAGVAHAVIETSTGYRISIEFDPATLSANGLGGAKVKVVRVAPDGTEIKPVGGRFPINSKYAGRVMPAEALPANIRAKYPNGIRFTSEGYPDFGPYAIKTVRVKGLTGDQRTDANAANRQAGLSKTPQGYTWHHHEDGVTMQLVPRDLHEAARHTGGSAVLRNIDG